MSFRDSIDDSFESLNHAPVDNTMRFMDNHGEGVVKTFMVAALLYATAGSAAWAEGGGAAAGEAGGTTAAAGGDASVAGGADGFTEAGASSISQDVAKTGVAETPTEALTSPEGTQGTVDPTVQASTNIANTGVSTPSSTPGVGDAGSFDQFGTNNPNGTPGLTNTNTTTSEGLIDKIMGWGKDNKLAAYGAMQVLGGIGNNLTQNQLMDKKTASDRQLLAQRTEEERKAAENRRKLIQSGSYFSGNLPFSATQAKPLRRPDGSLVYGSGLIANGMGAQ